MKLPAALRRLAAAGLLCLAPAVVPAQPAPATLPSTVPAAVPASAPASASASAARPTASAPAPAHAARRADCPPLPKPLDPAGIPQALQKARDRGLLWRVEKDGRTSWLYGTVHAARRGWMLPGPTVMAAVRASDRVALEMDLLDPTVMQKLQAALRKPADAPPLPPELERRLAAQRDAACADPSMPEMRPELQVSSLVVMSARREGFDPAYGIDFVLAGLARGLHKPVVSLESVDLQVQTLASDDPKETAAAVASGLDQLENHSARETLTTLATAWSDGRANLLETYGQWCGCQRTPDERQAFEQLVVARNPGMARAIVAEHRAGHAVFAAVGALHMVGPQGLPTLLAREGFRVERVEWPARP